MFAVGEFQPQRPIWGAAIKAVDMAVAAVVAEENQSVTSSDPEEERIFLWCFPAVLGCGFGFWNSGVDCCSHGDVLIVVSGRGGALVCVV